MTQRLPFSSRKHLLHRVAIVALFFSAIISSGTLQAEEQYSYSTDHGVTYSNYLQYSSGTSPLQMTNLRLQGAWLSTHLNTLLSKSKVSLETLDASAATNAGQISFSNAFSDLLKNGYPLRSIDLSGFTDITLLGAFQCCLKLEKVILPTTSNAMDLNSTFNGCNSLKEVINLDGLTNITNLYYTFNNCTSLESITLPKANTANSVSFERAFYNCNSLSGTLDLSGIKNFSSLASAFYGCSSLSHIIFASVTNPQVDLNRAFYNCSSLIGSIDLRGFTYIIDMTHTFRGCSQLEEVKLPTSNKYSGPVVMMYLFKDASKLQNIDISGFTNISNMEQCFSGCKSLKHVTLPSTNAYTNAVSFLRTFKGCSSLIGSIDLKAFTNISNFSYAFQDCPRLCTVYLSATPTSYDICFDGCNPNCMKFVTADFASKLTSYGNKINVATKVPIDPIVLTDKNDYYIPENITAANVSYTRSCYRDGFHETICLPFAPAAIPTGYAVSEYKTKDASSATFETVTSMNAGAPYLLCYKGTKSDTPENVTFSATNALLLGSPLATTTPFKGNFQSQQPTGSYILGVYDTEEWFKQTAATSYEVPAFRCYLNLSGTPSKGLKLHYNDPTGITSATGLAKQTGKYYDLEGRAVTSPQSGKIYIHEGHKVIYSSSKQ